MRALYVEDDPISRRIVAAMLSRHGFTVTLAEDGLLGLSTLSQDSFDVILTDLRMPHMDGLSFMKEVRGRSDAKANLPILVITADVTQDTSQACRQAGADGVLFKPIYADALIAAISSARSHRTPA